MPQIPNCMNSSMQNSNRGTFFLLFLLFFSDGYKVTMSYSNFHFKQDLQIERRKILRKKYSYKHLICCSETALKWDQMPETGG